MQLWQKLTLVVLLAGCANGEMQAQTAGDRLQALVDTSAHRLQIAQQVALAKWDSGAAVEDFPREEQVIAGATKLGVARGLDKSFVQNFFRAQIEANKIVQYSLLAEWRRIGKAPEHAPIDLKGTIRPELDQVQGELIAELADIPGLRAAASCRVDVAKAVGKYVSDHEKSFGSVQAIALDRALSAACN
jgi:chorismate mutase